MKFSVLMSVYYKEKPKFLDRALRSVYDEQTLRPDEIVLVKDGTLTKELDDVVLFWINRLPNIIKIVSLSENIGLGGALQQGLEECSNEIIARMDSDDISLPDRFKKQVEILSSLKVDFCSSWVGEFIEDENCIVSYRKLPEQHDELVKFAKYRSPMNHPAVMFKKSKVLQVKNYGQFKFAQDYHLWIRMILNGSKMYNLQEPLVNMRAGISQISRRRGLKYALNELKIQQEFYKLGFLTSYEFYRNSILKFIIRMMPINSIEKIYKYLRN